MARANDKRQWVCRALELYERELVAYALRLLDDLDRASDVVQDTFLKLWQADQSTVDGHLRPWLYTVVRNGAMDVLRKDRRMQTSDDVSTLAPPEASLGAGTSLGAEQIEHSASLLMLIDDLPPRQAEAVRLKFASGLSYKDISQVMDTTVGNVGVLIHTALKTIRSRMNSNPVQAAQPSSEG